MSNHRYVNETYLRKDRSFRVTEKIYPPSNELSEIDFIVLNRRLRYGRQPIPGVSTGKYRKLTFK